MDRGDGDTGIRGRGTGVKGRVTGGEVAGDRGRGGGVREILGAGVIPKFVVFYRFYSIFMYQCIKENSGIFIMNPALISL